MNAAKWIILFLVFFNSAGLVIADSGAGEWLGVEATTGEQEELEDARDAAEDSDPQTDDTGTLFGFYTTVGATLSAILNAINPGAELLKSAVPNATFHLLVDFSFAGMWVVTGLTALSFFRGVDL